MKLSDLLRQPGLLNYGQPEYGRNPFESELSWFKSNPHVGGMAAEDNHVVMNPYSSLNNEQKKSVYLNEMARLLMRNKQIEPPTFGTTDSQNDYFGKINNGQSYGSMQDIRETIAARLATGDSSAKTPSLDQLIYSDKLKRLLGY